MARSFWIDGDYEIRFDGHWLPVKIKETKSGGFMGRIQLPGLNCCLITERGCGSRKDAEETIRKAFRTIRESEPDEEPAQGPVSPQYTKAAIGALESMAEAIRGTDATACE